MEFYRRPLFTYSIILLLLAVQPLIHLYYQSNSKCFHYALTTLAYEALVNHTDIVNLNTRILCWIPTTLKRLDRALIAYETWAHRCDHPLFIIAGSPPSSPVNRSVYPFPIAFIADDSIEKYNQLSEKVLLSLTYIYKEYHEKYDWFFKGDDDTFVIVENLRYFLRRNPSNVSAYYGYVGRTPDRFYALGGAGYVLSQEALRRFGKEVLSRPNQRNLCRTDVAEDINLAACLSRVGITVLSLRDQEKLETFHSMTFESHFVGNSTRWNEGKRKLVIENGDKCCSPWSISFHSLSPDQMRMMHFLLYRLQRAPV
ncbi:unnamed protein product [Adineta ricciae]|uniref:N-acetylgalactosaminide beta-1,3-galactosyltransferase n=1 Tax=Adineta ricciae TaxID=249248 RepID=A0A814QT26_ADIRI|nr:unnamed protein product [Adineta ricciae]